VAVALLTSSARLSADEAATLDGTATQLNLELQALPCRPTIACTADLVPPGVFELEVGYVFRKLAGPLKQDSLPWLAKLTLVQGLQLQIGGNGPTFSNAPDVAAYLDDIVFGLKFQLAQQSGLRPSMSWSVALSVPVSAVRGFESTYDLLTTVYVTKDFAWLHADFNVGLDLWDLEGPVQTQGWLALALSVEVVPRLTVMAESYWYSDASPIAPEDAGFLAALSVAARPWLVFDVGGDVGYIQARRSFSLFAGMTFAIPFWGSAQAAPAPSANLGNEARALARLQPLRQESP
jgi:hypothetical protein